jgi:regulator of chromosome condensation
LAIAGKSLFGWGDCELGQIGKLPIKKDLPAEWSLTPQQFETKEVLDIFSACNHSFSLSKKGKRTVFKAWGLNNWGQLGIGNKTNTCVPTEVDFFADKKVKYATGGDHHSIVLTENGEIYSWGRNDEGQCGLVNNNERNGDEKDFSIERPLRVAKLSKEIGIEKIRCSMNYNYAVNEKRNEVYTWGMGESYVLGNKKDDNEAEPFKVPKEFYFNKKVAKVIILFFLVDQI